jgi:hypothetical protein
LGHSATAQKKSYIWDTIKKICNVSCEKNSLVIGGKKKFISEKNDGILFVRVLTSKQVGIHMHIVTIMALSCVTATRF